MTPDQAAGRLIDLEQHFSEELSGPAAQAGATGHADLIGQDCAVPTSTLHDLSATPGQHPTFHRDVMAAGGPSVQRVPHAVDRLDGEEQEWHVMAYSPLRSAPWGIAIGASETETLEVATGQRRTLFRLGIAARSRHRGRGGGDGARWFRPPSHLSPARRVIGLRAKVRESPAGWPSSFSVSAERIPARHSTMMVPCIPASRCPSISHTSSYVPGCVGIR